MSQPPRVQFSHVGFHVHDMDKMVDFYSRLLGLEVTDRGHLAIPGEPEIAFLSCDPQEHHQIALVAGRQDGGIERGVINQISFHAESLGELRQMRGAAEALGAKHLFGLNHGNAWSLYFADPEGNGVEVFTRTPWHVRQPVTDALDLSQSDEEITEATAKRYADAPDFGSASEWRAAFAKRLEARWSSR